MPNEKEMSVAKTEQVKQPWAERRQVGKRRNEVKCFPCLP